MGFIAQLNIPDHAMRAYIDDSCARLSGISNNYELAKEYLLRGKNKIPKGGFTLAALWADIDSTSNVVDNIDFFGFTNMNLWPGDSDIKIIQMQEGQIRLPLVTICGDSVMMLGQEEAYRRSCRNLDEYIHNPPYIFQPISSAVVPRIR